MNYASNTEVPVERSRAEIETTLRRFGADQFVSGWDSEQAVIGFRCRNRAVRFILPLSNPHDKRFLFTPGGRRRLNDQERLKRWEQACRENWRALSAVIKAKLVAVQAGITQFEQQFLAHIVLNGGETIGEHILPKLDDYKPGQLLIACGKDKSEE